MVYKEQAMVTNKERAQKFMESGCLCGGRARTETRDDGYVLGVCTKCDDYVILINPNLDKVRELRVQAEFEFGKGNDLQGELLMTRARILKDGGSFFPGLYQGERRVNAKIVKGKYGLVWLLSDTEADRFGRRFVPVGEYSKIQRINGLDEQHEFCRAVAKISNDGYQGKPRVCIYRIDEYGAGWEKNDR